MRLGSLFLSLFFLTSLCQPSASAHQGHAHAMGDIGQGGEGISASPMLNSETATTLGKNKAAAGFTFQYLNWDEINSAAEAHSLHHNGHHVHGKKHEETYTFSGGYGLLEDFDLYLSAPIVSKASKQTHTHGALERDERSAGFGDMRLRGKYRFWEKAVEASAIAGVKFPTGRTTDRNRSGTKFEIEEQPGSGSWDYDMGLAVSRSYAQRYSVSADFLYTLRTEGAQQYEAGDSFRQSVGFSAALRKFGQYPNAMFYLEWNNEWMRRDYQHSLKVGDSGGTIMNLSPGLSFSVNEHMAAFVSMPIPIYQNIGGAHEEVEYSVLTGFSVAV